MQTVIELLNQKHTDICKRQIDMASLPINIYCKSNQQSFIWGNSTTAQTVGLTNSEQLIAKKDVELFPRNSKLEEVWRHDAQVLSSGSPVVIVEEVIINGINRAFMTQKSLLKDSANNAVIGVLGIGIEITKTSLTVEMLHDNFFGNSKLLQAGKNFTSKLKIQHWVSKQDIHVPIYLTKCLLLLLQGKTAKQIANKLLLSQRTVEHYTAALKQLLGCRSTKELISIYSYQVNLR